MTTDQHIAGIQSVMQEVEQAQTIARKAMRRAKEATAVLHARLSAAAVEYRDTHGHNSDVMAAAVLPKNPPDQD